MAMLMRVSGPPMPMADFNAYFKNCADGSRRDSLVGLNQITKTKLTDKDSR